MNSVTLPPPPPPPPPLLLLPSPSSPANEEEDKLCHKPGPKMDYDEALKQVKDAVKVELERDGGSGFKALVVVTPVLEPILQSGPVCGLIALVEAGQVLGIDLDPDAVLNDARAKGMTKSGEMFSAYDMQRLGEDWLKCHAEVVDTTDKLEACRRMVEHLLKGKSAVLAPYDADFNHGPALRNGHAAHWAVIHGFLIKEANSESEDNNIVIHDPCREKGIVVQNMEYEHVYVIAHHGKSPRIAVWSYSDFIESNQNLHKVASKITADNYKFGDIRTDLCSKLIMLGQ